MEDKTQSTTQKCFEPFTQPISSATNLKSKVIRFQRKTDKSNATIAISDSTRPLLYAPCWESHCSISLVHTRSVLLSLCCRKVTHPRSQGRWAVDWIWARTTWNAKPVSIATDHMALNLERCNIGQVKADGTTEAPKTRWLTCMPWANGSKRQRDDEETSPILRATDTGQVVSRETWGGQAKQWEEQQRWRERPRQHENWLHLLLREKEDKTQTEKAETQTSISEGTDTQNTVQPLEGRKSDLCHSMEEPWRHYSKWHNGQKRTNTVWSAYMGTYSLNYRQGRKEDGGLQGGREWGGVFNG